MTNTHELCAYEVGKCYIIRTVTFSWTGRVEKIFPQELVLRDAAWIADLGRYHLATCEEALSEIEPRNEPVIIGRGTIVDAAEWLTPLPRTPK